jgi:hypothetical protein
MEVIIPLGILLAFFVVVIWGAGVFNQNVKSTVPSVDMFAPSTNPHPPLNRAPQPSLPFQNP